MQTLGLAIIARDEAQSLPTLLASIEGAFDHVSLLDTGSTDDTLAVFQAWAHTQPITFSVGTDTSCNGPDGSIMDFSIARDVAHGLIPSSIDWHSWADCDDVIVGAHELRKIIAQAQPQVSGFMFDYDYFADANGNVVSRLVRERLVRREFVKWTGRVHECILLPPMTVGGVDREVAYWEHAKHGERVSQSNPRNIAILKAWAKDEPKNPRVVGYLGTEYLVGGQIHEGQKWIRRYLKLTKGQRHDERAQFCRKLAVTHLMKQENDKARALAQTAIAERPTWPDSYLTLAEAAIQDGDLDAAQFYAEQCVAMGSPETLLIVNPLDYNVRPRVPKALAMEQAGRAADALAVAQAGLQFQPDNEHLLGVAARCGARVKFDQTAETWASMADTLIAHDEQLKALDLLDTVPHYAAHHPRIVALRADLGKRIGWAFDRDHYDANYEHGGAKPEQVVQDVAIYSQISRAPATVHEILELVA